MAIEVEAVHEALSSAERRARDLAVDPDRDRVIILSDQHKGTRDGADDFQRAERAYNSALTYYRRLGHHLVLLGDVEELWENRAEDVVAAYPETLGLEAAFNEDGHYHRVFGNHDHDWSDASRFRAAMSGHGLDDVAPAEAIRLVLPPSPSGRPRQILLAHGHQGTSDGDRFAWLSRLAVRFGWRTLQRWINKPWSTPAVDWSLRGAHAAAMASWATSPEGCVLITGHTHLPVFGSQAKAPQGAEPVGSDPRDATLDPARLAALEAARASWSEADGRRLERQRPRRLAVPSYFNTGCCSFGDGDCTGIEIGDGRIRLVRWSSGPDTREQVLGAPLTIDEVFAHREG
ncbi:hypothetical protein HJD18_03115 [Thermoleophilia bacterium SCSIO 60948]|nr:hypothetical protein HJD18_03115 [Thermoleophilia bacterium SCSIO 60948]